MPKREEKRRAFRVQGMDCAEEVQALRREIAPLVGGADRVDFDILRGRITVPASPPGDAEILAAVARAGLVAEREGGEPGVEISPFESRAGGLAVATGLGAALTAAGIGVHAWIGGGLLAAFRGGEEGGATPPAAAIFFALAVLSGLARVAQRAWLALRRLRPDMNLLMTVAVSGAVLIGEWLEAATVATLFALSLLLESWSVGRARRAVERLLDLSPPRARLAGPDGIGGDLVPVEEVAVGARVVVLPGERIPLDGRVAEGETFVDEAPITGESWPVEKSPGSEVLAGTINGDGAIVLVVGRPARETVLARIVRMVGDAQARRAPVERAVDRFARVYTPIVMALAAATFCVPPLLAGEPWGVWTYRGLVLLVIACPCALVISTPVSIVAALAAAARHGVLVKGGAFIEAPAGVRAVAFDKTGTVTEGRQRVLETIVFDAADDREVLSTAAALEARSEHPIGRAVALHAEAAGVVAPSADDVRAVRGKGIVGRVGGRRVWAGSHRLLAEFGLDTARARKKLEDLAGPGRTVVAVGDETRLLGFLALSDAVRAEARSAIAALRKAGVERIVLLTGDSRATADAVARETGIDEVRAELLPEDKVEAILELVRRHGRVAMVGDGVNDAPAMAMASVGIAMGAAGSDAAIEASDVALMSDDLARIPWLVGHSRRTLAVVRQNVAFALATKLLFVGLTYAGSASLWAAILADTGASLLVISNGLRLLRGPGRDAPAPPSI